MVQYIINNHNHFPFIADLVIIDSGKIIYFFHLSNNLLIHPFFVSLSINFTKVHPPLIFSLSIYLLSGKVLFIFYKFLEALMIFNSYYLAIIIFLISTLPTFLVIKISFFLFLFSILLQIIILTQPIVTDIFIFIPRKIAVLTCIPPISTIYTKALFPLFSFPPFPITTIMNLIFIYSIAVKIYCSCYLYLYPFTNFDYYIIGLINNYANYHFLTIVSYIPYYACIHHEVQSLFIHYYY